MSDITAAQSARRLDPKSSHLVATVDPVGTSRLSTLITGFSVSEWMTCSTVVLRIVKGVCQLTILIGHEGPNTRQELLKSWPSLSRCAQPNQGFVRRRRGRV